MLHDSRNLNILLLPSEVYLDKIELIKQVNSMNTNTERLLSTCQERLAQIQAETEKLQIMVATHIANHDPDRLDWGYAGDLERILELLREANGTD